jgi:hypothetical protein
MVIRGFSRVVPVAMVALGTRVGVGIDVLAHIGNRVSVAVPDEALHHHEVAHQAGGKLLDGHGLIGQLIGDPVNMSKSAAAEDSIDLVSVIEAGTGFQHSDSPGRADVRLR